MLLDSIFIDKGIFYNEYGDGMKYYLFVIKKEYFKKNDYIFIVPIEKGADVSCLDYID